MLLFNNSSFCQNLILNGSFEGYSNPIDCNGGGFEIPGSPTFHHVVNNWDIFNSPDYFNAICSSSTSWYNVPNNLFGINNAKHGVAYSGIGVYDIRGDYQEYINQQLSTPLKADSIYCLSFYTTRADRTPFAIKSIGAYFSVNSPTLVSNYYINAIPQIVNSTAFITDTINWIEIQGCFTAIGGEKYITIG